MSDKPWNGYKIPRRVVSTDPPPKPSEEELEKLIDERVQSKLNLFKVEYSLKIEERLTEQMNVLRQETKAEYERVKITCRYLEGELREVKRMRAAEGDCKVKSENKEDKKQNEVKMEIEIIKPPPKPLPVVIELNDDTPEKSIIEKIEKGNKCIVHPENIPIIPFTKWEDDNAPQVKIRFVYKIDPQLARYSVYVNPNRANLENFQIRLFGFDEPIKTGESWKQLKCTFVEQQKSHGITFSVKIEPKTVCHFIACLVQGNFRSKFSECQAVWWS